MTTTKLSLACIMLLAIWLVTFNIPQPAPDDGTTLVYSAQVCVAKNSQLIGCGPNVLTNAGKNHTAGMLFKNYAASTVVFIALGNTTAPAATDTTLGGEAPGCGLTRAAGAVYNNTGSIANTTITRTFTATCDPITINTTGLLNASANGILFAGFDFADTVLNGTLNDQLTINWTIAISEG